MNSLGKLAVAALAFVLSAVLGAQVSGATFTSATGHLAQVTSATDWMPPTVSVTSPGATIAGTVSVAAPATDEFGSGVASVQIQYSPADQNSWVTLCTDAVAPYSCSWATAQVADGRYDLRATATDNAGFTTTSALVGTRVANNFGVVLGDVPAVVKGQVQLTAALASAGTSTASYLYFEYTLTGTTSWVAVPGCGKQATAGTLTTRTCTWSTTGSATYDLRAVAVVGASTVYDVQAGVLVDNIAPAGTLDVPAGPLRGLVSLTSPDAADGEEGSGVASVEFQYRPTGTSSWSTCGVSNEEPWSCVFNSSSVADGSVDFRAVITDFAGNTTVTATVVRTVDNTVSTVSVSSPASGATVRGTVTVTASASSTRGITSVRLDASSDNGLSWLPICTDTTAPWSCAWDTSGSIGSRPFLLRAVMVESNGAFTTSASVPVTVDNSPLKGMDVQVVNGGTLGAVNRGDSLVLTYSGPVNLSTIKLGWSGASTPVSLTLRDKGVVGSLVGSFDRFDVTDANLGQIGLAQNQIRGGKSVSFTGSTMVASTATVGGVQVTVVTVSLGTPSATKDLVKSTGSGTARWVPSALALSPLGAPCSTALVLESGSLDRDL